ncbi:hypothetical protein SLEP1_g43528 [Rubroshorea leprosula]|uniref:Uncharacterized protein n=1 Tax=Rubroshorea leprosula TaxID=152421 RepID=A0AAV5LD79_9ROSI|nr:hypothetical protein SLEP1_g43528 [Rubroshorea leprosula]
MEVKVNQKEEGDVKKQHEVEGSQAGIMASQTPNSESAFKFDDSGFIDVPVLYCAEKEFKNLLWSNQGAMTSAANQNETVMPGYKEDIGNDCQTSWKSSELDELNATKLALETMEAQFNATKQALTIMEAKLDSMIEIERQNRKLLQALNNGPKNPTPSK